VHASDRPTSTQSLIISFSIWSKIIIWQLVTRDVRKPNFGSVFKNPNRTEAKRSNPKFRFPWLFSKPNFSHTNSQYLSHSHKVLTFFTLRTLSTFFVGLFYTWSTKETEPNQRFFSKPNRTHGFLKTEPNLKKSIPHIPTRHSHQLIMHRYYDWSLEI